MSASSCNHGGIELFKDAKIFILLGGQRELHFYKTRQAVFPLVLQIQFIDYLSF